MNDIAKIHKRNAESFAAAMAEESANLERARLAGDNDEAARAAWSMAGMSLTMDRLNSMAAAALRPPQPPAQAEAEVEISYQNAALARKYGLSNKEADVALKSYSAGTAEEKMESYRQNKHRYAEMRASGAYVDAGDLNGDRRR